MGHRGCFSDLWQNDGGLALALQTVLWVLFCIPVLGMGHWHCLGARDLPG